MSLPTLDVLPAGVVPIKDYRSLNATLVECAHAAEHQRPTGGWAAYSDDGPDADSRIRRLASNLLSEREARMLLHSNETLDYGGILRCRVCGGDEATTESFTLPVKMLAIVPDAASLF